MNDDYLYEIQKRVDEISLKAGFGEVKVEIVIKDGKVVYLRFINEEQVKIKGA